MSAAQERSRRATAGKRMSSLVGKALEDDNAFWGHETWADDDSGNDSFRESDEDSSVRQDQFDSDFDDSESDHDDQDIQEGIEQDRRIQREERLTKKTSFQIAQAGRELMQKKKGRNRKRVIGDGINAGIVLNVPGVSQPTTTHATIAKKSSSPSRPPPVRHTPTTRQQSSPRKLRTHRSTERKPAPRKTTTATLKRKRKRYTQPELLLEAATRTEPENERWLLARKRVQDRADEKSKETKTQWTGTILEKFHSRRGCLTTLTFPEMDHVPDLLKTNKTQPPQPPSPTLCVITGKPARYRDPRTQFGYYDKDAFRELRRRHAAGELPTISNAVDQVAATGVSPMEVDDPTGNAASVTTSAALPAMSKSPPAAMVPSAVPSETAAMDATMTSTSALKTPPVSLPATTPKEASLDTARNGSRRAEPIVASKPVPSGGARDPSANHTVSTDGASRTPTIEKCTTTAGETTAARKPVLTTGAAAQDDTPGPVTPGSSRAKSSTAGSPTKSPRSNPSPRKAPLSGTPPSSASGAPISPRRMSPRRRKPTMKILEATQMSTLFPQSKKTETAETTVANTPKVLKQPTKSATPATSTTTATTTPAASTTTTSKPLTETVKEEAPKAEPSSLQASDDNNSDSNPKNTNDDQNQSAPEPENGSAVDAVEEAAPKHVLPTASSILIHNALEAYTKLQEQNRENL